MNTILHLWGQQAGRKWKELPEQPQYPVSLFLFQFLLISYPALTGEAAELDAFQTAFPTELRGAEQDSCRDLKATPI